jgi:hypothetical protein
MQDTDEAMGNTLGHTVPKWSYSHTEWNPAASTFCATLRPRLVLLARIRDLSQVHAPALRHEHAEAEHWPKRAHAGLQYGYSIVQYFSLSTPRVIVTNASHAVIICTALTSNPPVIRLVVFGMSSCAFNAKSGDSSRARRSSPIVRACSSFSCGFFGG